MQWLTRHLGVLRKLVQTFGPYLLVEILLPGGSVIALALGGVALLTYPLVTDVWAHRIQHRLDKTFASPQEKQLFLHPVEGSPLTRLIIPKLHIDIIVVEGISGNALRAGAGHYPGTALPGAST